jgi:arylsulfatase A-like enzyme
VIEHFSDNVFPRMQNMGYQAVRRDGWKYIRYRELTGADELYDLKNDPYELKNLINDRELATIVPIFRRELDQLLEQSP